MTNPIEMRTCKKCGETKPLTDFPLHYAKYKNKNDYRRWECQQCRNEYGRQLYRRPDQNVKVRAREKLRRQDPKRKAYMNALRKRRYKKLRKNVINGYGGHCQCCGETTYEFLSIDHVNGGGNRERREKKYGEGYYRWLERNGFPDGYQILCHNCNMAKGFYGQCPHKASASHVSTRNAPQ